MSRITKQPATKKLNRRKVEDGILTYLQGGVPSTDIEFGEMNVNFRDRKMFDRGLGFKAFSMNGVDYKQAAKDEKTMTITFLFH